MSSSEETIYVNARIALNVCSLTYGQAPCTASGPAGFACVNTFATCQDKANYTRETDPAKYRLNLRTNTMADVSIDPNRLEGSYPCIEGWPRITSTEIKRGEGVAVRGGVDIICTDWQGPETLHANGGDPYLANRPATERQGTFWGKFKARHLYYNRAMVELQYRRIIGPNQQELIRTHEYRLDTIQGPDEKGKVVLRCKDILSAIDSDQANFPAADAAALAQSINPTATTFSIQNYNPDAWEVTGGTLICEEEAMSYAAFNPGTGELTGVVRGIGGTNNVSHDLNEPVTVAFFYDGMNVVDVIYDMLTKHAGIDPSYIDYNFGVDPKGQWDFEKETYLSGHIITYLVDQPTGVRTLLDKLCRETLINLWYDPADQQIKLSATSTGQAQQSASGFLEDWMLTATQKVIERQKQMLSQVWVYYGAESVIENSDPRDYSGVAISVNTELESANAWDNKRVRGILGRWLFQGGNIAVITAARLLDERSVPQYELSFEVDDAYIDRLPLGGFVNITTSRIQTYTGASQPNTWQIVKSQELIPTARHKITAVNVRPLLGPLRFGTIVNVANEGVEYGDASPADRDAWCWIAGSQGYANGDDPHVMS